MTGPHGIAMPRLGVRQLHCLFALLSIVGGAAELFGNETGDFDGASPLPPRAEWTASRVVGSPNPPPPYTVEQVFTNIEWNRPIFATREPNSDWLIVIEWTDEIDNQKVIEGGAQGENTGLASAVQPAGNRPARLLRVRDRAGVRETETLLALYDRQLYCMAFHPNYDRNGQIFVCGKIRTGAREWDVVLSRFTVTRHNERPVVGAVHCDPESETEILRWSSKGHDGAAVVFGHDGMLYVTTGDGTGDSDDDLAAQDIATLQGAVLRIDVESPAAGKPYSVPKDNPFVDIEGARGEIWSLGHRNPWRMSVDEKTGHLWVGNNGQDLWEFAHLIRRGDNCGWSVYEGSHPFYLQRQRGPGNFAPPTIEHHHSEFRSLTGGVVCYGSQLPDLEGAYVYGDYSTGAIWGAYHDGDQVVWNRQLASTALDIVGFSNSHRGEMLVLDHASGIYRLVKSPPDNAQLRFPRRLSETGLFASTADHVPSPGVYPYSVNAPGWADGADADRLIAIPNNGTVRRSDRRQSGGFPDGAVFVQTLSLPSPTGSAHSALRIETRLMTLHQGEWAGYSYLWNEAQDDAELVDAQGAEITLPRGMTPEVDGVRRAWHVPSRTDCMSCHSRAAGFVLGFTDGQLDRPHEYEGVTLNQLEALIHWQVLSDGDSDPKVPLTNPYDKSANLEARARSYLHVNCAVCHVAAGGGNARMQLDVVTPQNEMKMIGAHPQHQTLGLQQPMLVAPGAPERSVLLHRISRRGPGQMPPRGTYAVDRTAVELFDRWIRELVPRRRFVKQWTLDELTAELPKIARGRSFESGRQAFHDLGCAQCHRFAGGGGGTGPDLSKLVKKRKVQELLESIHEPSKQITPGFETTIIQTISGRTLSGRIQQENAECLVLASNTTDALSQPITVLKKEIESRSLSSTSTMPSRLLDTLEAPQILDLLVYLLSNADPNAPAFTE